MSSRRGKLTTLLFSVLFLSFLTYIIDHNIENLPWALQLIAYMSIPIAGGLVTLSFCFLLSNFVDSENSMTSHILRQISEDPVRNLFVGFLVTAYLYLVRPSLAAHLPFLPYMEWIAIALAAYAMYTVTSQPVEELYVSPEERCWKKHNQVVRKETGCDLMRIISVMEEFINRGVKEPLLVHLALHLQRLGVTEEGVLKTLKPLIDYREKKRRHKLYFLFFPWKRRKFARENMKARENLLKNLLEKIKRLGSA